MKLSWLVFCDIRTDGSSSTKETVEGYDSRTESIVRIFYDPLLSSGYKPWKTLGKEIVKRSIVALIWTVNRRKKIIKKKFENRRTNLA